MTTAIGPIHPVVPSEVLQQHVAIVGRTGSGKTYAAKGMVECLLDAGRRCLILDPTGAWHGLRSTADGKSAGFPVVVLGGEHADVPIDDKAGGAIAHLVAEGQGSFIVDTSEFTQGEKHRLVTDLFEDLYRLNTRPLQLILDEADDVAPQHPLPESRRMFGAVDRIVRRGRKRGFRVMLISQRPAVLNKNVLSQAATLIAMKLPAPQDRKALEAWIEGQADVGQGKKVIDSLPKLARGEGWVWFPEQDVLTRTTFPANRTFDSGRSPEDDDPVAQPTTLAPVDLAEIRRLLSPAPEGEEIAGTVEHTDEGAIERARAEGYAEGEKMGRWAERSRQHEDLGKLTYEVNAALGDIIGQIQARQEALRSGMVEIRVAPADIGDRPDGSPENRFHRELPAAPDRGYLRGKFFPSTAEPAPSPTDEVTGSLTPAKPIVGRVVRVEAPAATGKGGAELKILKVLAQRHPAQLTEAQWATLAGMKRTGGTWRTYKSRLKVAGLITEGAGLFSLTPAGLKAAGSMPPAPRTKVQLLDMWAKAVGGAGPMLRILAHLYPSVVTQDDLAQRVGMARTGGTFRTYLSRLRSNGLVEERSGQLRASPTICEAP